LTPIWQYRFIGIEISEFTNIGGDGTYLRTAGIIENKDTPMLGINTDPTRSIGFLCNNKIYNDTKEKQLARIFDNLDK